MTTTVTGALFPPVPAASAGGMAMARLLVAFAAVLCLSPGCCSGLAASSHSTVAHNRPATAVYNRPGTDPDRHKTPQDAPIEPFEVAEATEHGGGRTWLGLGVLDGHGRRGHDCADYLAAQLPLLIRTGGPDSSELAAAFETAHRKQTEASTVESRVSGAACVVALIPPSDPGAGRPPFVRVANAGDCRGVMGRRASSEHDGERGWVGVALSEDSTVAVPAERARVLEAGARVDAFGNVFAGPVGIAMTRVLGDDVMARVGVKPTPTVLDTAVTDDDAFVVLVSDGISGVLSDDEIASVVGHAVYNDGGGGEGGRNGGCDTDGDGPLEEALALLAGRAVERWQSGLPMEVKVDDITAVAALL